MPKAPQPVTFDHFRAGLYTNRSPLSVPSSNPGTIYAVAHPDALIDGSNVELTPHDTIQRRAGMPKFCSVAFGSSEWPLNFWGGFLPNSAGTATLVNLVDTQTTIYTFTSGAKTSIFSKAGTTGQTFFQKVGNILYFSDGAENMQWDGSNTPTKNGTATPTLAPTIPNLNLYDTVGASQTFHAWVPSYAYANSTSAAQNYFLLDPNNNIQWSVIAKGTTNNSQATVPNWAAANGTFGAVTQDGTMTWTNCGQILAWAANTVFTNSTYVTTHQQSSPATVTTAMFTDTGGGTLGAATIGGTSVGWNPGTGTTGNSSTLTITNLGLVVPTNATVQGIQAILGRASNRANAWSDVTVQLLKAGVGAGNNKALAGFWPQTLFGQYTIPTTGGIKTVYGSNSDLWGTTWTVAQVTAANFGLQLTINNASTRTSTAAYTLPITIAVYYIIGTSDITGTVYAQIVKDSNGNLQAVKTAGTSGGSAPAWSTTIGGTTADNTITWQCLGTGAQMPALFSWTYGYSFHTLSPHTSTLSPLLTVYGPMIGNNVNIQGFGSADTQVDRNDLYRSPDGGALLLFNQSAPNVNASTSWTINDNVLDINLDISQVGPIAHLNDPPPAKMTLLARYQGRMWGAVGNLLYFSAGPDCTNGNGDQAWPPANVFVMTSQIIGLEPTSQGLVVGLQDELWAIVGGPQTLSFYPQQILQNFGVLSPNCLLGDGDVLYFLTSTAQLQRISVGPNSSKDEIGFPIADLLLTNFPPASSYLAVHRNGADEGLFVSNGSTLVQRYSLNKNNWSPAGTITGGIGAIASIQTATGVHTLVGGRVTGTDFILGRSLTNFVDGASSTYSAFATIGSLILSPMGTASLTKVKSFVVGSAHVGTAPTVSVLPNEISGAFTSIPFSNADPYQLPASSTVDRREFQWLGVQSQLPNAMRHVQVKLTLASENAASEILALAFEPSPLEA